MKLLKNPLLWSTLAPMLGTALVAWALMVAARQPDGSVVLNGTSFRILAGGFGLLLLGPMLLAWSVKTWPKTEVVKETQVTQVKTADVTVDPDKSFNAQLDRASNSRNTLIGVSWTAFSVFAAGNAILANGAAQKSGDAKVQTALAILGFLSCVVWLLLIVRVQKHLALHKQVITALEGKLTIPTDQRFFGQRLVPSGVSVQNTTLGAIGLVMSLWLFTMWWVNQ